MTTGFQFSLGLGYSLLRRDDGKRVALVATSCTTTEYAELISAKADGLWR
jgi:hypothetical protein